MSTKVRKLQTNEVNFDKYDLYNVTILGTDYKIVCVGEDDEQYKELNERNALGLNCSDSKEIILDKVNISSPCMLKQVLRHEILHSFLFESGLDANSFKDSDDSGLAWALNEEMVDWFAIQSPKIFAVYKELGIL